MLAFNGAHIAKPHTTIERNDFVLLGKFDMPLNSFLTREITERLVDALGRMPGNAATVRDLFGIGCYLHACNDHRLRLAGSKAIRTALDTLKVEHEGFITLIRDNLSGNEEELAHLFCAHREIMMLFQNTSSHEGQRTNNPMHPSGGSAAS